MVTTMTTEPTNKKTRAKRGVSMPYLRAWREHFGYMLIEVSRLANIDSKNMSKYERNLLRPSAQLMERVANVYGISRETLIFVDHATVVRNQDELRERALRDLARRAEQQEQILATYAAQSA